MKRKTKYDSLNNVIRNIKKYHYNIDISSINNIKDMVKFKIDDIEIQNPLAFESKVLNLSNLINTFLISTLDLI